MSRGWSLAGRLSRHILPLVALGWVATIGLVVWALDHEIGELMDEEMETVVQTTILLLDSAEHGHGRDPIPRELGLTPDSDEQVLRVTAADLPVAPAPWGVLTRDGFSNAQGWRVLRRQADGATIEMGHSLAWRREEVLESTNVLVVPMLPLLALVLWATRRTMRRSMSPVGRFASEVTGRRPDDLSPLETGGLPDELRPLALSFNDFLHRIDALRQAERHFVANAAHELRTPLATLRARLETGGPDVAAQGIATLDALTRRVERLLQLSRAEAGLGREAGEADLVRILRLVLEEEARHSPGPIRLDDGDVERLPLRADPDALAILLRNLIENAVQHGIGDVRLRLYPEGRLTLSNAAAPDAAFRMAPFDKRDDSPGTGLGLAIVQALAEDLGLTPEWRIADGRASVTLDFAPVRQG